MAFGSWLKNITKKVVNGFKKALPVIQKIGKIGASIIAPGLSKAGTLIGGNAGKFMGNLGNGISSTVGAFDNFVNGRSNQVLNNKVDNRISPESFSNPILK